MTMEKQYLELEPVSQAQPGGADVRYEAEFEALQAEIDKLSLPSSTSSVNWAKVRSLASDILKTRSKDLLVGAYLAVAEIHLNNVTGLADGLAIFRGLLERYWDNLFPAKKRMRGRLAAVTWLLEKSEAAFAGLEVQPVEADFVIAVRQDISRVETLLQQHLEDAPVLRPLERIIDGLPLREAPLTDQQEAAEPEPRQPPADRASAKEMQPPSPSAAEAVQVSPAPTVQSTDSVSAADMEKILRGAFQTIRQAADFYFDKDPAHPRGYRCRRVAGWTMIQSLPPAVGAQTQIPAPGEFEQVKKRLQELRGVEHWTELLRESEGRLNGALLWLDLNRFSAESLVGLGKQYSDAHTAVCQETAFLLTRLPGLEKLTFADGSPLADAETKQWVETILPGSEAGLSPVMEQGTDSQKMEDVLDQARQLAAGKKLDAAVLLLQNELQRSGSARERLLWRLGLAQVLLNARRLQLALPHLDEIVRDIDMFTLEQWDPDLAVQALKIAWLGYRADKETKTQADTVLSRVARLNPVAALQLEVR